MFKMRNMLLHRIKKFQLFGKKIGGVAKTAFYASQKHFEEKSFPAKNYESLYQFRKITKLSGFPPKKLDRAVETAFCLSIKQFRGKKIFGRILFFLSYSDFELVFFNLPSNNFLRGFQSCILCFHQNVLKKKNLLLKKIVSFFNTSGFRVNDFWSSAIKHSLGQSKLDSECPKDLSEAKKLFLKTIQVAKHARTLNKRTSTFREKNRRGCQNCFLCFHRNIARKKTFSKKLEVFLRVSENEWNIFDIRKDTFLALSKLESKETSSGKKTLLEKCSIFETCS